MVRVLADFTTGALISVRSLFTPSFLLYFAVLFLCFVCLYAFECSIVDLVGVLDLIHRDNLYLFVSLKPDGAKACFGHP